MDLWIEELRTRPETDTPQCSEFSDETTMQRKRINSPNESPQRKRINGPIEPEDGIRSSDPVSSRMQLQRSTTISTCYLSHELQLQRILNPSLSSSPETIERTCHHTSLRTLSPPCSLTFSDSQARLQNHHVRRSDSHQHGRTGLEWRKDTRA
jgi:hypothetical protein